MELQEHAVHPQREGGAENELTLFMIALLGAPQHAARSSNSRERVLLYPSPLLCVVVLLVFLLLQSVGIVAPHARHVGKVRAFIVEVQLLQLRQAVLRHNRSCVHAHARAFVNLAVAHEHRCALREWRGQSRRQCFLSPAPREYRGALPPHSYPPTSTKYPIPLADAHLRDGEIKSSYISRSLLCM